MLLLIRLLNGNLLEGQVPEELYSIGVHGGAIEYVLLDFVTSIYLSYLLFLHPR